MYLTKRNKQRLEQIRDIASMETAHFSPSIKYPIVLNNADEVNAFVKESIVLWLHTWIYSPLSEMLKDETS